jgi:hypothetical protein
MLKYNIKEATAKAKPLNYLGNVGL